METEEFRRTFWSVYLLDKLVSCGRDRPTVLRDNDCSIQLPCSELHFRDGTPERTATLRQMSELSDEPPKSLDHFAVVALVASCLGQTSRYMLQDRGNDKILPWDSKSEYTTNRCRLLDLETRIGYQGLTLSLAVHLHFSTGDTIDQQRIGHFVFSQMLFHLTHCLLSHPFLLRERLKCIKRPAPTSFLREGFLRCREHATAMLQLVTESRAAGYRMEASFYGYCICIAGGIQVLYLNNSSAEISNQASVQLQQTLSFMTLLAHTWKHIPPMIMALKMAAETASSIPVALTDPSCTDSSAAMFGLDVSLWWYLVDYGLLSDSRSNAANISPLASYTQVADTPDPPAHPASDASRSVPERPTSTISPATQPNADAAEPWFDDLLFTGLLDPSSDQHGMGDSSDTSWGSERIDGGNPQAVSTLGNECFWPTSS
ncbi:hypothetical protein LTR74_012873 [Friedmanniomyces endolithicus]|nr:hypothetical protein LTR74_012873 [Friedmanniomyces endolithicus]